MTTTIVNPDFSFESALRASLTNEGLHDPDNPFSTSSPLSSPPTSRSPSPTPPSGDPSSAGAPNSLDSLLPSLEPSFNLSVESQTASNGRKRRNKTQSKLKRKRQRQEDHQSSGDANPVRSKTQAKFAKISQPVPLTVSSEDFTTASAAFMGRNCELLRRALHLDKLVGPSSPFGFRLVKWDGQMPKHILDDKGCIIAVCTGWPQSSSSWDETIQRATAELIHVRTVSKFSAGDKDHARGRFPTLSSSFAHGGSQREPLNQCPSGSANAGLTAKLISIFEPIASFQSSTFAHWAPRLHKHYEQLVCQLCGEGSQLKRNWAKSIFASAVFNLGPKTVCFKHRDFVNLPYGWCAVFPPGSIILIPSAIIAHSNIAIQEGETHYSFTQYSAGALFCWVAHNMKSNSDFLKTATDEELADARRQDAQRWHFGLGLFSMEKEVEAWLENVQ
ncbi:hypothetical protein H0H92_011052 [Tricholoma furcatifolium]|nr:hypothetical protein H0H92_011052 [Tricholoma furcatifolium]